MSNAEISLQFYRTAQLKELAGQDFFRFNRYYKAAEQIDTLDRPILDLTQKELEVQLGKSMAEKAVQAASSGMLNDLEEISDEVPITLLDILRVPGLGTKKVRQLWQDMSITTLDALEEAARNGKLTEVSGFGKGMQEKVVAFFDKEEATRGFLRIDQAIAVSEDVKAMLEGLGCLSQVHEVGSLARALEVVDCLEYVAIVGDCNAVAEAAEALDLFELDFEQSGPFRIEGRWRNTGSKVKVFLTAEERLGSELVLRTGPKAFLKQPSQTGEPLDRLARIHPEKDEKAFLDKYLGYYLLPLQRDNPSGLVPFDEVVTERDIKGLIHCHSTYSDGQNTIEQMARACMALGYEYMAITDHSKTAQYARGLQEDRLELQWKEIDELNKKLAPFKIFKGIESDILADGALDYDQTYLKEFDWIVASVHSNLKMDEETATGRLLNAIKNPYTSMLGHATGRLLLQRDGFPLEMDAILEACAELNVVVEINADPHRLDLDWRHVPAALGHGCRMAVNPDAHSTRGIDLVRYGLLMANKGGCARKDILNTLTLAEFEAFILNQKKKRPNA